jgi:hypothetical protein
MADTKITALTALTAADPINDVIPIVDVSDTSMAASGTTKKISVNNILGAGGTATLASATVTGAATVGTTLGVTGNLTVLSTGLIVNTTGVGVGVTPTNNFHVKGASGTTTIKIEAVTDGSLGFIGSASGMISGSPANNLAIRAENGLYLSGGGNATQFILNSAGNVTVSTGNVVMGTSGKGIDFTAAGNAAGMTSELLNDYEEGTWTGTLTGGTTNPTVPVTATGKYTKIGRQVTVAIYFFNVSTVGASGSVNVIGLPFTEDGTRAVGTAAFYNFDFNGGTGPFVDVSGATMFFQSQLTNSNWRDVNHSAGVGRYLRATLTYFV